MPDDASLDARLRRMAEAAIARDTASVDVDAAADQLRRRIDDGIVDIAVARERTAPRLAIGVAAGLLVLLAVGTLLVVRGGGSDPSPASDPSVVPPTTAPAPVPTAAPTTTTAPTTGATTTIPTDTPDGRATAEPIDVRQGEPVTITPASTITRTCADVVTARAGDGAATGQISAGTWVSKQGATPLTVPDCEGITSAEAMSLVIPRVMPTGTYDLCLADPGVAAGCARVSVQPTDDPPATCAEDPVAPPTLADGSAPGTAEVDGDVARWGPDGSPAAVTQLLGPADTSTLDSAQARGSLITAGRIDAAFIGHASLPADRVTIYLRDNADGCVRTYDVGPGVRMADAEALTYRWVQALAERGVDAPAQQAIGVEYYGQGLDGTIERFGTDGSVDATLSVAEVDALNAPQPLPDGSTLTLTGDAPQGRCLNRSVAASGGMAGAVADLVAEARRMHAAADGTVVLSRDVCDGQRWGEPGTRWELLTIDASLGGAATPEVLLSWASDPGAIVYDDGEVIVAYGEMQPQAVSPDGRYLSVVEWYAPEGARWHLLDLHTPGTVVQPVGSCPIAGDIVGPPRFLDDGLVVLARPCASIRGVGPFPTPGRDGGDVHIDAVALDGSPEGTLAWSTAPAGLQADSHSHTVQIDAIVGPDEQPWVLVTANGGVEEPSQSLLLRGMEVLDVTRPDHGAVAFDPALLLP